MFFIVPKDTTCPKSQTATLRSSSAEPASKRKRVTAEPSEVASYYPRRIPKACDRCRLKKARCTGGQLCQRCKHDGVVCVTSQDSKRPALLQNPGYVHLVESQRDQLVQALSQILQSEDTPDCSKSKKILADMGIDTKSLQVPRPCSEPGSSEVPPRTEQQSSKSCNDMLESLDGDQLQLIESFYATIPPTQDIFMPPYLDMDLHNDYLQQCNSQGAFRSSEVGNFADLCSWSQDVTLTDEYGTCDFNGNRLVDNPSSELAFESSIQPNVYNSSKVL